MIIVIIIFSEYDLPLKYCNFGDFKIRVRSVAARAQTTAYQHRENSHTNSDVCY